MTVMCFRERFVQVEGQASEGCAGGVEPVGGEKTAGVPRGGGEEGGGGFEKVDGGGRRGGGRLREVEGGGEADDAGADDYGCHRCGTLANGDLDWSLTISRGR